MADETLLTLATDIISAHVSNNKVATEALPGLIAAVYDSLAGLGQVTEPAEEARTPAVSIRASVKPDSITCLECGKKMKLIKRHLGTDHQLTPEQYRNRWNLPADYPLVAPNYAERRKELAVKIGLGQSSRGRPKAKRAENSPKAEAAAPGASKPSKTKTAGRKKGTPADDGQ